MMTIIISSSWRGTFLQLSAGYMWSCGTKMTTITSSFQVMAVALLNVLSAKAEHNFFCQSARKYIEYSKQAQFTIYYTSIRMVKQKSEDKKCVVLRHDGARDPRYPDLDLNDDMYGLCSTCQENKNSCRRIQWKCRRSEEGVDMERNQKAAGQIDRARIRATTVLLLKPDSTDLKKRSPTLRGG